jgi:hypothetical protein
MLYFMNICSAAVESLCANRQIDKHGEANMRDFEALRFGWAKNKYYCTFIIFKL